MSHWGGRNGCRWGGLYPYTFHLLLTQRRGLGLCQDQAGMRGRTLKASRAVGFCDARPSTGKVGNANLPTSLSIVLLEGMRENSPDAISSCRTLPKVVPSGSASAKRVRKRRTTSEMSGRHCGLWFQQCSVRSQRSSVNLGLFGRPGRSPDRTSTMTVAEMLLWNGTFPVNTLCTDEWHTLSRWIAGTYLDDDHRPRIHIRFLTDRSFRVQDLRCGPSHRMAVGCGCSGP